MAQRFTIGDAVTVKFIFPVGHVRTPPYIRGKTGVILGCHGDFRNPETLAYGGEGLPRVPLYAVGFEARHVAGNDSLSPRDRVVVDIFEHWLEPAA